MSSVPSKDKTESRNRTAGGSRRQTVRSAKLRRLTLDRLEERTLMAVLPTPVFNSSGTGNQSFSFGTYQTSGAVDASNSEGNESSPSIAVDPNNPLKLVSAW